MSESKRKGVSVHLGLNTVDPDHYRGWDGALQGCENDARDMTAIAKAAGFETTTLLTKEVTAEAAIAAIAAAAEKVGPGDLFWLTYSGHGSQVPDKNSDEPDKLDETWVLYNRQLVDDELFDLWSKFQPGVRILVLSDSCHSGSAVRADARRAATRGARRSDDAFRRRTGCARCRRRSRDEVYEANQKTYDDVQARVTARRQVRRRRERAAAVGMPGQPDVGRRRQERPVHPDAARGVERRKVPRRAQEVLEGHRRAHAAVAEPELVHRGARRPGVPPPQAVHDLAGHSTGRLCHAQAQDG